MAVRVHERAQRITGERARVRKGGSESVIDHVECSRQGTRNHWFRDTYAPAGDAGTSRTSALRSIRAYRTETDAPLCSHARHAGRFNWIVRQITQWRIMPTRRCPPRPHARTYEHRNTSTGTFYLRVPRSVPVHPVRSLRSLPHPFAQTPVQVCCSADYCGPLSNSRHVKAIPGTLLIVMQSRLPDGANRTGS